MTQKYPRKRVPEPKECAKQGELDRKAFELKVFDYIKKNLSIIVSRTYDGHRVILCLRNPITEEIEEITTDSI